MCRNESKYFKWLATKSGLLRECPVTWSTGHECIVSERDQTEDVCFTMYVYLTKLECIVSERDQTEDVCFTMYVYWPKHECIVSERDQTEDACFTMHVYLIKLECIAWERDQTEDVCFTMYVYLTKHECIVSERDQTEDACFKMHVYLIKLENSLLLVLCIQQNVRFYLYPHWIIKYFLCMKNCGTRCFINNSHSTYNITAFLFIY